MGPRHEQTRVADRIKDLAIRGKFCLTCTIRNHIYALLGAQLTPEINFWKRVHFSLTLCDPMDCSTLGFPVLHYLLEFAQIHVY